ncbi:hypothetical protein LWI29_017955 [Acer saccharum]|uniref:Uncharacterized protein n=1 Tax=Acer saccharum TaxID=4024 RepID=A0AA39SNP6_ACESA|nr:hypothetical protein LWI29_017955 [Acer saccharum]
MTRRMQFSILISHYSLCLLLLLLLPINHAISEPEECQTYIIHMDHSQKPASFLTHESWHQSIVNSLLSTADDREMLLYSYNHVMHGFSASLTPFQLSAIEKSPAHLATYPESFGKLFTTYSPKFLGLQRESGLWPAALFGEGVIIGIVDTGIWPESESFSGKGNDGSLFSTYNGAPWIATVGAATLDRSFTAMMTLENRLALEGISYFPESIYITNASLYYGKDNVSKAMCNASALDQNEVAGKVVLCDNSTKIDVYDQMEEVERAGAYAGIFLLDISDLRLKNFTIPSLILDTASGTLVRKYVTEDSKAKVKGMRFTLTKLGAKPAPQVASFSSRGPDPINPGVLKPDILSPGVDVLAAVTPIRPFIKIGKYKLVTNYALGSGTSMATPHVAGVAALLKAVHKEWSPAAIRSAIMTTAYTIDNTGSILKDESTGLPATPLDFAAGHIDANRAMDPGFVYDMDVQDYIEFLCGLGYDEKQMKSILRLSQWNCSQEPTDLNYPSFMAIFNNETVRKFSRVVMNVGVEEAVYHANLKLPTGMKITIEPSTLTFTGKYQKQNFVLSIETDKEAPGMVYGFLNWIDQHNHTVSSPIVVIKT